MQVDFAPTVAILMGVPIPYGSIGRVSPELWNLTGDSKGYCDVLLANAWQVRCPDLQIFENYSLIRTT